MNPFVFTRPPLIHFGAGNVSMLPRLVQPLASNILLVTGSRSLAGSPAWAKLTEGLRDAGVVFHTFPVSGEPTVELVNQAAELGRSKNVQAIVAIGGGSVIDTGKATAAMLKETGSVQDYLEGVGTKEPSGQKVPFIAVPTTAGTGSEATKNTVISRPGPGGFKKSLRHDNYMPDIAVVDPELTLACPPAVTAACGLDALTQLLEAYVSTAGSPLTDALAESGLARIKDNLVAVCGDKADDIEARTALSYAALLSGLALANAGLGVVHGLAATIGGMYDIPHGAVCGTLVGPVTRVTIDRLRQEATDANRAALRKYAMAGWMLTGRRVNDVAGGYEALVDCLMQWRDELHVPRLAAGGVIEQNFNGICIATENKYNPVALSADDLQNVLRLERE